MRIPLSRKFRQLRKALWHLRTGGLPQLRLWWSRQESRRALPSSATGAGGTKAKKYSRVVVRNSDMAREGFPLPARRLTPAYAPQHNRVLYLLHNSLPYHSGGYATRTHGLLTELNRLGWHVSGTTRLGYPYDMPNMADLPDLPPREHVGEVEYFHLLTGRQIEKKNPMFGYVERYMSALLPLARQERPVILHGASNHWNGLAAIKTARILGIRSVYEVRGLWEVTRGSRDPEWGRSDQYRYIARMEADAARSADRVIAITGALRDELISRGVPAERITVVPNGVDTERFTPLPRDEQLAAELGVTGTTVIGYVGTIADYEGLNLLVEAAGRLRQSRDDFHVLVVGDGAVLEDLQEQVSRDGLTDVVSFLGRVPHEDVERYYSLIDIAPFPRLPRLVTEMVSPLKPFEAMAMGKAVVASDVGALAEIVTPDLNGLLHTKGDADSLTEVLATLLDDRERIAQLGRQAREWVVEHRDWRKLAPQIAEIYQDIAEELGDQNHAEELSA